jgi:hypothetical protein
VDMKKLLEDELGMVVKVMTAVIAEVALRKQGHHAQADTEDKRGENLVKEAIDHAIKSIEAIPEWLKSMLLSESTIAHLANVIEDAAESLVAQLLEVLEKKKSA